MFRRGTGNTLAPHAALSDVKKFLDRGERVLVPADGDEVLVDDLPAELVGKRVRE